MAHLKSDGTIFCERKISLMDQRIIQETDYNIGNNLRLLRKRSGMKQREVVAKLQLMGLPITREIYAQIETGRHHIKITVLRALKEVYHASWDEMLEPVNLNDVK